MNCIEAHWNLRAPSYDEFVVKGFADSRERRAWQDHFASILGDEPLGILDVGCGPGIVSMQLAEMGHRMTSVDISDDMIARARKNADENGLSIDFRKGDAMSLDFADESFDAVVSDYMLWTVPDPEKVFSEWMRVLKPGGTLAFTDGDWFHDPKSTRLRCGISSIFYRLEGGRGDDGDMAGFEDEPLWSRSAERPSEDLRMARDAGFEDIGLIPDIQKKVLHGARYLAHGLTNTHYTVVARKPLSLRCTDEERERDADLIPILIQSA